MSLPIIAGAAGVVALLFAGSKEKPTPTPTSEQASPTQQSTGGANGGAQAPSHSDVEAATEADNAPSETIAADNDTIAPPSDPWADPGTTTTGGASSGPLFEGSADAPISTGVAGATGMALGGYAGQLAGATTKVIGESFEQWGSALGAIW